MVKKTGKCKEEEEEKEKKPKVQKKVTKATKATKKIGAKKSLGARPPYARVSK